MEKLTYEFYHRPCPVVARELVGKVIIRGETRLRISETEVYWGEGDTACHAHKGKTKRAEVLWADAGTIYVYLCYGMHWMLNIVTGEYNRKSILKTTDLWIEDDGFRCEIAAATRIGIGYASQEDQDRLWRFKIKK